MSVSGIHRPRTASSHSSSRSSVGSVPAVIIKRKRPSTASLKSTVSDVPSWAGALPVVLPIDAKQDTTNSHLSGLTQQLNTSMTDKLSTVLGRDDDSDRSLDEELVELLEGQAKLLSKEQQLEQFNETAEELLNCLDSLKKEQEQHGLSSTQPSGILRTATKHGFGQAKRVNLDSFWSSSAQLVDSDSDEDSDGHTTHNVASSTNLLPSGMMLEAGYSAPAALSHLHRFESNLLHFATTQRLRNQQARRRRIGKCSNYSSSNKSFSRPSTAGSNRSMASAKWTEPDLLEQRRVAAVTQKFQQEVDHTVYYDDLLKKSKLKSKMAGLRRYAVLFPVEINERRECWLIARIHVEMFKIWVDARYSYYLGKEAVRQRANAMKSLRRVFSPIVKTKISILRIKQIAKALRAVQASNQDLGKEDKATIIIHNCLQVVSRWLFQNKVIHSRAYFFRQLRVAQRVVRQYSQTRKWQIYLNCRRWDIVLKKLRKEIGIKVKEQGNPRLGKAALAAIAGVAARKLLSVFERQQELFQRELHSGEWVKQLNEMDTNPAKKEELKKLAMSESRRQKNSNPADNYQLRMKRRHNVSPFLSGWFERHDDLNGLAPNGANGARKKRKPYELELDIDDDESDEYYAISLKEKKRVIATHSVHRFHQHTLAYREFLHKTKVMSMTANVLGKDMAGFSQAIKKKDHHNTPTAGEATTEGTSEEATVIRLRTGRRLSVVHADTALQQQSNHANVKWKPYQWLLSECEMLELLCKYFRIPYELEEDVKKHTRRR